MRAALFRFRTFGLRLRWGAPAELQATALEEDQRQRVHDLKNEADLERV